MDTTKALLELADRIDQAGGGPLYIDHTASVAIRAVATSGEAKQLREALEKAREALMYCTTHARGCEQAQKIIKGALSGTEARQPEADVDALRQQLTDAEAARDLAVGLCREAQELCSAAQADVEALRRDAWQPIETAPKDGTPILLWAHGCAVTAEWCRGDWELLETGTYAEDGYTNGTHWMPLPEAPGSETEALWGDAERLDWLATKLFTSRWNGSIGADNRVEWYVVPNYRHITQHMAGETFREAIDAAKAGEQQ